MPSSTFASAIASGLQWRNQEDARKRQEAEANSPEMKRIKAFQLMNLEDEQRQQAMMTDALQAKTLIANGDTQGAMSLLSNRAQQISQLGGNPRETQEVFDALRSGRTNDALGMINNFLHIASGKDLQKSPERKTANIQDYEYHQELLKKDPQKAEMFANKAGLSRLSPTEMAELEVAKEDRKARDKERIKRISGFATNGVGAADGVGSIKRAITLLGSVETSGYDKMALAAKRFFGVDSANEGELAFLLGKNVLSQLRETFGAAFTAKEGETLQAIEANFGRSAETNIRLLERALKTAQRAANRGIRAANEVGDEFTANEIMLALEKASGELSLADLDVPDEPDNEIITNNKTVSWTDL